ncbi:hypothetical protein [Pararhizobium arenae]|uniref:hypothetical protein n=1 Tax=Pararhizobium arenae TaxID=1856850 RepID=UPI00094AD467|nr:hypothetical protein [Pararhizobium arenae]
MPNPAQSPAVQSLRNERAQQSQKLNENDLHKALEHTFPASDPLSIAHTSVPSGRADTDAAELVANAAPGSSGEISTPHGDDALNATDDGQHAKTDVATHRRKAERLPETVSELAPGSKVIRVSRVEDVVHHIEDFARAKPLKAVAIAGTIAFLFGLTR